MNVNKLIQSLPPVPSLGKDLELVYVPVKTFQGGAAEGAIFGISDEDGQLITGGGLCEVRPELEAWAAKNGGVFECIYPGTFGFYR